MVNEVPSQIMVVDLKWTSSFAQGWYRADPSRERHQANKKWAIPLESV